MIPRKHASRGKDISGLRLVLCTPLFPSVHFGLSSHYLCAFTETYNIIGYQGFPVYTYIRNPVFSGFRDTFLETPFFTYSIQIMPDSFIGF